MLGWEASGQAGWTEAWLRVDWSEPVPQGLAYSMGHVEQLKYSGGHKAVGLRKASPWQCVVWAGNKAYQSNKVVLKKKFSVVK